MGQGAAQKLKIGRWDHRGIAIISGSGAVGPGQTRVGEAKASKNTLNPGQRQMNQFPKFLSSLGKALFILDFRRKFFASSLKLLLVWNPIWTLVNNFIRHGAFDLFWWEWSLSEVTLICLLGLVLVRFFVFLQGKWAVLHFKPQPSHGNGWHLLFLAFFAPAGMYLSFRVIINAINYFYAGESISPDVPMQFFVKELFWIWPLFLVIFLFMYLDDLRNTARQAKLKFEELEKERLQAALDKLKDQMNPHFLFNTLNTVAALIPADPVKAEEVVVKLSTIFQGVLEATRKANHSLEKELEFCRNYLDIEKARFGHRLAFSVEIEAGLDPARVLLPVLLIQPLVENAVKHGLSSRAAGGKVWIKAALRDALLAVTVEDDGVGFGNSSYAGSGTALNNCRKRLELGFGEEGRLEIVPRDGGGTKITLSMPVLKADGMEEK